MSDEMSRDLSSPQSIYPLPSPIKGKGLNLTSTQITQIEVCKRSSPLKVQWCRFHPLPNPSPIKGEGLNLTATQIEVCLLLKACLLLKSCLVPEACLLPSPLMGEGLGERVLTAARALYYSHRYH
jgi:hypothetical protein